MNISSQQFLPLAGLVVIVGGAIAVLAATGLFGDQGGGTTDTGVKIENVAVLEPPRTAEQADLEIGPEAGQLAPDFEISDSNGSRRRLSEFRGKPVYLNFWATWCTPCLKELPDIAELQQRLKDELVIIVVNRREPLGDATSYLANLPRLDGGNGVSFDINGQDPGDTLYGEYQGATFMPLSFFIDAEGVITSRYNGIIPLETMEDAVSEALTSTQASSSPTDRAPDLELQIDPSCWSARFGCSEPRVPYTVPR